MKNHEYGVLKCKPIDVKEERDAKSPHYQIHVKAHDKDYKVSINIKSSLYPSELLFYHTNKFEHNITNKLLPLPYGFNAHSDVRIDYVRGNYGFTRDMMQKVPYSLAGPNNDLNEKLNYYIMKSIRNKTSDLYVFGHRYLPHNFESTDYTFGFSPALGMHNIHMNQGNTSKWRHDDKVWEDGCIIINYNRTHWIGLFLAFQSQSFHTDDRTGHRISKKPRVRQ